MRSQLRAKISGSINSALKLLGYKIIRIKSDHKDYSKNSLIGSFFNLLNLLEFQPHHILDVGANRGTWTRTACNYFPNAFYSLVEPQYWLEDSVKDLIESSNKKIKFFPIGVSSNSGKFLFSLTDREDSCTFRFSKEEASKKGLEQIELPVTTINDLIIEHGLTIPDIVKIDAEGLDLEVLKGASNLFGKTEIFLIEVSVGNKNMENTVKKVLDFMDSKGYRMFDITDLNRPSRPRILWLMEIVFVLKGGHLDS